MINNFKEQKILIVGDVILDRYLYGIVNRISPEAPIPVVKLTKKIDTLGGAANVANNIKALGGEPYLVSVVGGQITKNDDESITSLPDIAGLFLLNLLEKSSINVQNIIIHEFYNTIIKTRIIAHNQHVVRVDEEFIDHFNSNDTNFVIKLLEVVQTIIIKNDIKCIILSDYLKGTLCNLSIINIIKYASQKNIPVIVDSKRDDWNVFSGASCITPNTSELALIRMRYNQDIPILLDQFNIDHMLLTMGEEGMILFTKNQKEYQHIKATAKQIFDVTGAGDTVVSTLAMGIAAGMDYEQAAKIANVAAGIVVGKIGTATVSLEELNDELSKKEQT